MNKIDQEKDARDRADGEGEQSIQHPRRYPSRLACLLCCIIASMVRYANPAVIPWWTTMMRSNSSCSAKHNETHDALVAEEYGHRAQNPYRPSQHFRRVLSEGFSDRNLAEVNQQVRSSFLRSHPGSCRGFHKRRDVGQRLHGQHAQCSRSTAGCLDRSGPKTKALIERAGTCDLAPRNMKMISMLAWVVVAITASSAVAATPIQQGTLIHLADGDVQGQVIGGSRQFLGIPFAAPPIGALRWRPPAPTVHWSGVLQAASFASGCPQLPSINGTPSTNEDCLYLNVWTPDPRLPERCR